MQSRFVSRVLLSLGDFPAVTEKELYKGIYRIPWDTHISNSLRFRVHTDINGNPIRHTHYASQIVKDGIADFFRGKTGRRPSVDTKNPDITVRAYLNSDHAYISLDLSGSSLHIRGNRISQGEAPLKENTAAAMLLRAGWGEMWGENLPLIDPMCGSGTLLMEAAYIAANIVPNRKRGDYGFFHWKHHNESLWSRIAESYSSSIDQSRDQLPPLYGFDIDKNAVAQARENCRKAGLEKIISISRGSIQELAKPPDIRKEGLICTNPPYGIRIGRTDDLPRLYNDFGKRVKEHFLGWRLALLTSDKSLARAVGLKASKLNILYNGGIKCILAVYDITDTNMHNPIPNPLSSGGEMFLNRIKKNTRNLKSFLQKEAVSCYRLYDKDMPEYAAAIDIYQDSATGQQWAAVQEYAPPKTIDQKKAEQRFNELLNAFYKASGLPKERVIVKTRSRQKGKNQYNPQLKGGKIRFPIKEGTAFFYIDLNSYIDTGIFLDHRILREKIGSVSSGKKFLNLFAYTCTASVFAALGGAEQTVSVDQSKTYLQWGKENFLLNNIPLKNHEFLLYDCIEYLNQEKRTFNIIFIDPPTFSNRKGSRDFIVQKDYRELIQGAEQLLAPKGIIIFSNNFKGFTFDKTDFEHLTIENITDSTIPFDFQRKRKIHHVFIIQRKNEKREAQAFRCFS